MRDALRETEYFHPPERLSITRAPRTTTRISLALLRTPSGIGWIPNIPIVAHLSGGLDSSSIVCHGRRNLPRSRAGAPPFHLVSAIFPGKAHDESAFIDEVTRTVRFQGPSVGRQPRQRTRILRSVAEHSGVERDVQRRLHRRHRDRGGLGARVILSGDPGDAVTGEHGLFNELLSSGELVDVARRSCWPARRRASGEIRFDSLPLALREEAPHLLLRAWRATEAGDSEPAEPRAGCAARWIRDVDRARVPEPAAAGRSASIDSSNGSGTICAGRGSPGRSIGSGTYAASAGLEMRFPLLDVRLVRFILSVPVEHRLPRRSAADRCIGKPWSVSCRIASPSLVQGRTFARAVVEWGHRSLPAIRGILGETHGAPIGSSIETRLRGSSGRLASRRARSGAIAKDGLGVRAVVHLETWLRAVFRYPRTQETPSMSEIRLADRGGKQEPSPRVSRSRYVPPELTPVGNVRDLLARPPGPSDDGVDGLQNRGQPGLARDDASPTARDLARVSARPSLR